MKPLTDIWHVSHPIHIKKKGQNIAVRIISQFGEECTKSVGCLIRFWNIKMDVVCDTNVWYGIAAGRISKETVEMFRLHPTWVNLVELARTPNLTGNLPLVQKAVKALYSYNSGIFETNPIEFIIKKQHSSYECKDSQYKEILKQFEKLVRLDVTAKVGDDAIQQMQAAIDSYKAGLQKSANDVNALLPSIRQNINETTGKLKHRKQESLPIFFDVISMFVTQYTKGKVMIDIDTYPWHEIELFIRTWDNFFKELEVSQQKFKPNDWLDLFNMVYVSPTSKYLTFEKQWIKFIEADKNTSPYLLQI